MQRYIVVTGIPASGKSTIGRSVADAFGLEMIDKDHILETLFNSRGVGDTEWRRQLSRAADESLQQKATQSSGAVIVSWWRHPDSETKTGTPIDWLSLLTGTLVELHCVCSPETAAERFLSRERHEGHLDRFKTRSEILSSFQDHAGMGPLGTGRLVEIDTEQPIDLNNLTARLENAFNGGGGEQ